MKMNLTINIKKPIPALSALIIISVSACNKKTTEEMPIFEKAEKECEEPSNPYSDGTGHFAGWAWAEEKSVSSCGGNSSSFNEGCEEYLNQEQEYQECLGEK